MTLNVPITLDLNGIEALLGSIGKGSGSTTIQDPIVNEITVAVADPNATTVLDGIQATDAGSISVYGRSGRQIITILANQSQAASLAEYLVRPAPEYWFSSLEVLLNGIPSGDRNAVAELEIGDQIRVSKRFPNVANPVVQELFVEAVEHDITVDRHVVRIYCSPASLYRCFVLDASDLDNDEYGLAATGAVCSLNTFSTTNADSVTIIDVAGEPYWVADWKASGTVTFDQATEVEYLVVGGGGSGGRFNGGGGGGGGAVLTGSISVAVGAHNVVVGAGGAVTTGRGNSGNNSTFLTVTANGGGGGGQGGTSDATLKLGRDGGNGGGGGSGAGSLSGNGGVGSQGFDGGVGRQRTGFSQCGGGGGGAGQIGGSASSSVSIAGNGGDGVSSSISGTSVVYGGGGGGAAEGATSTQATGGSGGGGNGEVYNTVSPFIPRTAAASGVNGLGGGGGGWWQFAGTTGGDGRVIIRWRVYAN